MVAEVAAEAATKPLMQTITDGITKYLIDIPTNALADGLTKIGLNKAGNVIGTVGDKAVSGLSNIAAGNIVGLKDLYSGTDTLVGGILPGGQKLAEGYLGQLYTGADKMLGGYLPNFNGVGYVAPNAANATLANTGGDTMVSDGFLRSQDVYGPQFTDARLMDGTPIKFSPTGKLLTSMAPPLSGLDKFMSIADPAVKLAGAVGTIGALLDGKGGSGGRVPTEARGGKTSSGSASSRKRDLDAPESGGGTTSGLDMGRRGIGEQIEAGARSDTDAVTSGETNGDLGATQATRMLESSAGMGPNMLAGQVDQDLDNLIAETTATESAVDAQEEVQEEEVARDAIQNLVTPQPTVIRPMSNIPGGPRAEYLSQPVYQPGSVGAVFTEPISQ